MASTRMSGETVARVAATSASHQSAVRSAPLSGDLSRLQIDGDDFRRLRARVDAKNNGLQHVPSAGIVRPARTDYLNASRDDGRLAKKATGSRPRSAMAPARRNVSRATCRLTGKTVS